MTHPHPDSCHVCPRVLASSLPRRHQPLCAGGGLDPAVYGNFDIILDPLPNTHCQVLKNTPPSPLSHSSYPRSGTPRHFCLPRSSQLNTSVSSTVQSYRTTHPRCVTRPPSLFDLFKLCAHAHWALLAIQSCAQFDPSRSFLSRSLSAGIAYKAPEPTLDSIMDLIDTKCANFDIISDHFCAFPGRAMCTTSCLCVSAAD